MNEIEEKINLMYSELKNPRNDGWVQELHLKKLIAIKKLISSLDLDKQTLRFKNNNEFIKSHINDNT